MKTPSRAESLARTGALAALALLFSYLESLFPLPLPLPGFKLGLGNVVVLFAAFFLSLPHAAVLSLLKILVSALLFGNPISLLFSLFGSFFSFLTLIASQKLLRGGKITFVGASVLSAAAFNAGQILFASLLTKSPALLFYLPALLLASLVLGGTVGLLLNLLSSRLARLFRVPDPLRQDAAKKACGSPKEPERPSRKDPR